MWILGLKGLMNNLPQSASSLPSSHSGFPSHCHLVGIQRVLSAHWNWELEQVAGFAIRKIN